MGALNYLRRKLYQGWSFAILSFGELFIHSADIFVHTSYMQAALGDMPSRSLWCCKGPKGCMQIILVPKKCDKTLRHEMLCENIFSL